MGKHRRMGSTCKKFAALGAAAAATTALTVAVVPDSQADKDRDELLRLLADIRPFGTDPQAIPDLTGGFGTTVYDLSEGGASQFLSLTAPSGSSFPDDPRPQPHHDRAAIRSAEFVRDRLRPRSGATQFDRRRDRRHPVRRPRVSPALEACLNADPGGARQSCAQGDSHRAGMWPLRKPIGPEVNRIFGPVPELGAVRVIPVVGVGLGAFAAGAAYQQVVDDLANQPGGENSDVTAAGLGSYTILPMILVLNPGRANGGPLARAYPFFRLFGIDTVTPETQVQSKRWGPDQDWRYDTGLALQRRQPDSDQARHRHPELPGVGFRGMAESGDAGE